MSKTMSQFKEIKELRKEGALEEALEKAENWIKESPDEIWAKRAASWVYYDLCKKNVLDVRGQSYVFLDNLKKLIGLNLDESETMIYNNIGFLVGRQVFEELKRQDTDNSFIKELFELTRELHVEKPSDAYSFLLKAFHKAFKETYFYIDFIDAWDLKNLKTENYSDEVLPNGKKIMSLAEQVLIAYSKMLLKGDRDPNDRLGIGSRVMNEEKINAFLHHLNYSIENYPDLKYPPYYKGKLLMALGDGKEGLKAFLPFARKNKSQFWVWDLLGDFHKYDDAKSMVLYAAAMSCKSPKEFFVNVKEKLAKLLVSAQKLELAKGEILDVIKIRTEKGWNLSSQLKNWQKMEWYAKTDAIPNSSSFYKKSYEKSIEYLYPDLVPEIAAIEYVNKEKNIANWIVSKEKRGFFKYKPYMKRLEIGDKIKIKTIPTDRGIGIISAEKTNEDTNCIQNFSGKLKMNHTNKFGFINDIFIPGYLLEGKLDGDFLSGKAILSFNKKRNEWGWKTYLIGDNPQ